MSSKKFAVTANTVRIFRQKGFHWLFLRKKSGSSRLLSNGNYRGVKFLFVQRGRPSPSPEVLGKNYVKIAQ